MLAGCNQSSQKTNAETVQQNKEQEQSEQQENQKHENQKKITKQNDSSNPQVTSAESNRSRPLSDFEGSAKDKKKDELYVVPNKFPEKEQQNENSDKEQNQQQEDPPN